MRKNYLLVTALAFIIVGCKKETKEIIAGQSPETSSAVANISPCYGNTWTAAYTFQGRGSTLVYNNKAYVFNIPLLGGIKTYDGTTWSNIASTIPFNPVAIDYKFVIGNKGYLGFSFNQTALYEYDFDANTWTQKASFPGPIRFGPASFAVGNKGYIAGGENNHNGFVLYSDSWEYNPGTNTWTQKASFPFLSFGRQGATGFTIGDKGYVVNGRLDLPNQTLFFNSLLQYDPATNVWTYKANFPGDARSATKTFILGGFAYAGGGFTYANDSYRDFYKYNPLADVWTRVADLPVVGSNLPHSFALNGKGYIGYEYYNNPNDVELEKYTPLTCPITPQGPLMK